MSLFFAPKLPLGRDASFDMSETDIVWSALD